MEGNNIQILYAVIGLTVLLAGAIIYQGYQISAMKTDVSAMNAKINRLDAVTPSTTLVGTPNGSTGTGKALLQEVLEEITPVGTPDYGTEAGVSYDNIEQGLSTLMGYHQSISLSGEDQQRYVSISTTPGTACEFCCGIGGAGFGASDGRIACGCSHNVAFSGLTKWLIKNSNYTDSQIVEEIQKWKTLFFPQGMVEKELENRNISPEEVGLPAMRGGC